MSLITFQLECQECHKIWTDTFGIIVMNIIYGSHKCPNCGSDKVNGKWDHEPHPDLHEHTHDIGGEG